MAQAAEQLGTYEETFDREEAFRAAQRRAFRHMGAGWYGPNFKRTVREGIAQLLEACETYIAD